MKASRIPLVLVYSSAYVIALSLIDHKEHRFYTPVVQIGLISQAYFYEQLYVASKPLILKRVLKLAIIILMIVTNIKFIFSMYHYEGQYWNMLDSYVLLNGRSHHFPNADKLPESVYFIEKYE